MELATIVLRLSGQTQNTVVKTDVSPPQAAIYAYMHGEDCIQSLKITGIDKTRTIEEELNRLDTIFTTKYAQQAKDRLFPGRAPRLPATFNQVGFNADEAPAAAAQPIWQESQPSAVGSGSSIRDAIRQAAELRQAEGGFAAPVHDHELRDQLDDNGHQDEEEEELSDDPLDAEIRANNNLPPAPGGQE